MATRPIVRRIKQLPLLGQVFSHFHFHSQLKEALKDCQTVLDLGCGGDSPLTEISKDFYSVGIDMFQPSIDASKALGIHDEYRLMDVMDIDMEFGENAYDCVVALDLIEHLEEKQAALLMAKMERVARKKIILFTPNGFLPQGAHEGNPFQEHKSGWSAQEMKKRGYKVLGFGGMKWLRGERYQIKWKPRLFWNIISHSSQPLVQNMPEIAFSILCIKFKQ